MSNLTFKNTDEIPDKPHPNCRCWIEVSDGKAEDYQDFQQQPEDDELCDCWKFFDEIEEIIGDAKIITHRPADDILPEFDVMKEKYAHIVKCDEDVLTCALFENVAVKFLEQKYNPKKEEEVEVEEFNVIIG